MTIGQRPLCCIACAKVMTIKLGEMYDDRYGYPGYFGIYQCPACKQSITLPLLENSDLANVYSQYYPRKNINIEEIFRESQNPMSDTNFRLRRKNGTDNQGQYLAKAGMTVLDFGCGSGASLLELKAMGVDAFGVEADPNVQQVKDKLQLQIHIGSIDSAGYVPGQFDMIILNQVIEHIPDPSAVLEKLRPLLKPSGTLILSLPNADSLYARIFKRKWINWHVPYHLHHFNKRSLELFFNHNNWEVASLRTITPNLWTYLQFKILTDATTMGRPSEAWTQDRTNDSGQVQRELTISPMMSKLRNIVLASQHAKFSAFALTVLNRLLDSAQLGDSFLIEVRSTK